MEGLWSIQWEVVMARVWSMVSLSSFLTSRTVAVIICRHGSQPSATVSNLWVDRPQVSPVFEPILLCHPLIVVYKQLRRFSNVWKGKPWCLPKSCFKALKACLSSIQAFPSFGGFIENPEVAIFHWTQEFPYLPFGCRWGYAGSGFSGGRWQPVLSIFCPGPQVFCLRCRAVLSEQTPCILAGAGSRGRGWSSQDIALLLCYN